MSYFFIKSKLDGNVIDIQRASTKGGALLDSFPQKTTGTDNQLWEFVPDPAGSGYCFIKSKLDGNVIDIQRASTSVGAGLDAFPQKTSGTDNQLWQFLEDPAGSGYCFIKSKLDGNVIDIHRASTSSGAGLDAFQQKISGTDNQLWAVVGGSFPLTVLAVPAPTSGLLGNSNYYLYGGVKSGRKFIPLMGLVVTIEITDDLVGTPPFSFQLNAWSPKAEFDAWQQYGVSMIPNTSQWDSFAENWPTGGANLFNLEEPGFVTMANGTTLPKGTKIVIELLYSGSNISGSICTFHNAAGANLGSQRINIIGQPLAAGGTIAESDLAPIVALQLNLVGWGNYANTVFSSGAGTITYSSTTPMTALSGPPPDAEATNIITGEQANSGYSVLQSGSSRSFHQSFGVSSAHAPTTEPDSRLHRRTSLNSK
jgi:Ricin-type beta-trefoil lectin domain-like